jgi:hypothetical protein
MSELKITNDIEIISHPQYKPIMDVIDKLQKSGIIWNLHGNCFAAADMVSTMLIQSGVDNQIVECQVSICKEENGHTHFCLVGYDNFSFNGQVDTHVVVVTKTSLPVLIDLSISQYLSESHPFIVVKVDQTNPDNLCDFKFDNFRLIYQVKRNIRMATLHQKSLLDKIKKDGETTDKINFMSRAMWVIISFTIINFIANMILIF